MWCTLVLYNTKGAVVRQFTLGHQSAGFYTARAKAVYWNGRNDKRRIRRKRGLLLPTPCRRVFRVAADGHRQIDPELWEVLSSTNKARYVSR